MAVGGSTLSFAWYEQKHQRGDGVRGERLLVRARLSAPSSLTDNFVDLSQVVLGVSVDEFKPEKRKSESGKTAEGVEGEEEDGRREESMLLLRSVLIRQQLLLSCKILRLIHGRTPVLGNTRGTQRTLMTVSWRTIRVFPLSVQHFIIHKYPQMRQDSVSKPAAVIK